MTSTNELIAAITRYVTARNQRPTPFVRTASGRQILSKVNKANETPATPHWGTKNREASLQR